MAVFVGVSRKFRFCVRLILGLHYKTLMALSNYNPE